ncbi:MAG: long-chain fatty acid--CoA ligase [Alphaproteobacteria bacterium]|nr:long-chain fatty acid--CoA ligase [Alphaproteobacteria bacterium]
MTDQSAPEAAVAPAMGVADHPWNDHYAPGVDWRSPVRQDALPALLAETVARRPDASAVDFFDKKLTYGQLGGLVDKAALGFQKLGVKKGVHVGIMMPNCPFYVVTFFGILKAGGTVVNFNPLYAEREIAFQVADSEISMMVTLDLVQLYPKVAPHLGTGKLEKVVVGRMADQLPFVKGALFKLLKRQDVSPLPVDDRHITFKTLAEADGTFEPVEIDPHADIAVLQYTGGTTGTPKGAVLTHANLSANINQLHRWIPGLGDGEHKILCVLPLFHVFAMTVGMGLSVSVGAELILLPKFEINELLKTIDKKRPTMMPGVPTLYTAINNHPKIQDFDLTSIEYCVSGGAPLPAEVREQFEKLTNCRLVEGYGLSETSPVATTNPIGGKIKAGSTGIPMPHTVVEVRDPDDPTKLLPQGESGEVCIRGPQVMQGYWKKPEESANAFADGAFRTGDVGFIDDEGYVFLIDRLKDLILCGGFNVYPRQVEEAFYLHPAVAEAIVIGVEHPYRGQAPKGYVVLKEGESVDEAGLLAFLEDKLSKIEQPVGVEFRDSLPKTSVGKLSRKDLAREEAAKAQTATG